MTDRILNKQTFSPKVKTVAVTLDLLSRWFEVEETHCEEELKSRVKPSCVTFELSYFKQTPTTQSKANYKFILLISK